MNGQELFDCLIEVAKCIRLDGYELFEKKMCADFIGVGLKKTEKDRVRIKITDGKVSLSKNLGLQQSFALEIVAYTSQNPFTFTQWMTMSAENVMPVLKDKIQGILKEALK